MDGNGVNQAPEGLEAPLQGILGCTITATYLAWVTWFGLMKTACHWAHLHDDRQVKAVQEPAPKSRADESACRVGMEGRRDER
jgi:hypothetical protein